jgi:hypothetical protein
MIEYEIDADKFCKPNGYEYKIGDLIKFDKLDGSPPTFIRYKGPYKLHSSCEPSIDLWSI